MDEGLVQHKDKDGLKWLHGILTNDKVLDCRSIKEGRKGREGGGVDVFHAVQVIQGSEIM